MNELSMHAMDFSGQPSSRVSKVGVIVSCLDAVNPALHGFMGAIDWAGHIFAGNAHRTCRMQSWLSHFAIVIEFAQSDAELRDLWLLERHEDGVTFRPFHPEKENASHKDFHWNQWHHCDNHFPGGTGSGSGKLLCNIYASENNSTITRESVWNFVKEQMKFEYNVVDKNCKHFAYDFYYYYLLNGWVRSVKFSTFTEAIEAGWVEHRGW